MVDCQSAHQEKKLRKLSERFSSSNPNILQSSCPFESSVYLSLPAVTQSPVGNEHKAQVHKAGTVTPSLTAGF